MKTNSTFELKLCFNQGNIARFSAFLNLDWCFEYACNTTRRTIYISSIGDSPWNYRSIKMIFHKQQDCSAIMLYSSVWVYFIGASWGEFSDFYDSLSSKSTIFTLFVPLGPNWLKCSLWKKYDRYSRHFPQNESLQILLDKLSNLLLSSCLLF